MKHFQKSEFILFVDDLLTLSIWFLIYFITTKLLVIRILLTSAGKNETGNFVVHIQQIQKLMDVAKFQLIV